MSSIDPIHCPNCRFSIGHDYTPTCPHCNAKIPSFWEEENLIAWAKLAVCIGAAISILLAIDYFFGTGMCSALARLIQ